MPNPRKPRQLKVIEGTLRRDRDYPEPEFPVVEGARPPDWLNGPEALAEWDRLTALLESSRVLTQADLTALAHLCNLHGACVKLYRAGMEPTAAQLTQLRLMLAEFGLTPASRSKAGTAAPKDQKNPFQALG